MMGQSEWVAIAHQLTGFSGASAWAGSSLCGVLRIQNLNLVVLSTALQVLREAL